MHSFMCVFDARGGCVRFDSQNRVRVVYHCDRFVTRTQINLI